MGGKELCAKLPFVLRPMPAQNLSQREHPLVPGWLVKDGQSRLSPRLAHRGQMSVDRRRVERLVTQVTAHLTQGNSFFQQMGGIAVAQSMSSGLGMNAAGRSGQTEDLLHRAVTQGRLAQRLW